MLCIVKRWALSLVALRMDWTASISEPFTDTPNKKQRPGSVCGNGVAGGRCGGRAFGQDVQAEVDEDC